MPINSPRTMGLQAADAGGGGLDEANAAFEQGFTQIAYNVLTSRMPDVIPQVVTFKVITADVERGSAVGAFIVLHGSDPIYIPVIMADNQIKPLEVFYNKRLNIFLPLTKQWLAEMEKTSLETMGSDVKPPDSLATDVDIRNIVVPPITGRYSYAADAANVDVVLSEDNLDKVAEPKLVLLDFLRASPNPVKEAFVKVLETNTSLLKTAANIYGIKPLADALRLSEVKTAATQLHGGALWIADKDTNTAEFKRMFGDKAPEAYRGLLLKGYAAKDERTTKNHALTAQPYKDFEVPTRSGVYRLQMVDGDEKPAMVFVNPTKIVGDNNTRYSKKSQNKGKMPHNSWTDDDRVQPDPAVRTPYEYLVVMPEGSWTECHELCAQDSVADELSGDLYKKVFTDATSAPRPGLGIFVRTRGMTIEATEPVRIKSVVVGTGNVRKVTIESGVFGSSKVLVTDPKAAVGSIVAPKGSTLVFMPDDFVWVPLKDRFDSNNMHKTPSAVLDHVMGAMKTAGVAQTTVKSAGAGQYSIDGKAPLSKIAALKALAVEKVISVDDAEALLNKAAADGVSRAFIVTPTQLAQVKKAAEGEPKAKPKKETEAAPAPEDEAMQAQMEAQMAQEQAAQAAAQPSAVDLAAAEMQHMLQLEQQKLVEKQQMLAQLTQRANEIASGAPVAPPIQSQMMGAPPPGQMAQPAQPAQDPNMMGQDPNAMGQDPSMMAQDPNAMGQDPNAMGQPAPMPMMSESGLNASTIQEQINPQFLEMAGDLQSADVFDAAAVSSLANNAAVRELVGQYMPNLETALDNLGRVLISLWMKESDLKTEVGGETFSKLEDNLRNTFKGLGDLVLKLNQNAQVLSDENMYEDA